MTDPPVSTAGSDEQYTDVGWIDDDGLLDVGPALRAGDDCTMLGDEPLAPFGSGTYVRREVSFATSGAASPANLAAIFGDDLLDRINTPAQIVGPGGTMPRHVLSFDAAAPPDADLVFVQLSPGYVTINDREIGPMVVRMRVPAEKFLANLRGLIRQYRARPRLHAMHAAYRRRRGMRRYR
jgi:hypothetical protein